MSDWAASDDGFRLERHGMSAKVDKRWDDWWWFNVRRGGDLLYSHAGRATLGIRLTTQEQAQIAAECCLDLLYSQTVWAAQRRAELARLIPEGLRHMESTGATT